MRGWTVPLKAFLRESFDPELRRLRHRRQRFYAQMVGRGDLCFDVGANVGNRVAVFRALGASVVAVEPQPDLARYLRDRYPRRVSVIEAGAGPAVGQGMLRTSSSHTVASMSEAFIEQAREERWFGEVTWGDHIAVPVVTLDSLIKDYGKPQFVKVDVEGFEAAVLDGLSEAVPWLSFEYTARRPEGAERCVERLEQIGNYEFGYSPGESCEWLWSEFRPAGEVLAAARTAGSFGDIYARLVHED